VVNWGADGSITTTPATLTVSGNRLLQTYTQWAQQNFTPTQFGNPAISADTATPFKDDMINLLKYVFDINPSVP